MSLSIVPNNQAPTMQANQITVIAKDPKTGVAVERELPIKFRENQYGTWLEGIDEFGDSQAIVIFTDEGIRRMDELLGEIESPRSCINEPHS